MFFNLIQPTVIAFLPVFSRPCQHEDDPDMNNKSNGLIQYLYAPKVPEEHLSFQVSP